jgi:hypothetical protein
MSRAREPEEHTDYGEGQVPIQGHIWLQRCAQRAVLLNKSILSVANAWIGNRGEPDETWWTTSGGQRLRAEHTQACQLEIHTIAFFIFINGSVTTAVCRECLEYVALLGNGT